MDKKQLKQEYFVIFIVRLFIIAMLASAIIACAVSENSISMQCTLTKDLLFYGLIITFSLAELYCIYDFTRYCKDFKAAKYEEFEEITGTVVKFARNQNIDTGQQINCIPIVQIKGSKEIIRLRLKTFTKIGQTYTFIYLKHTKIGAVKTTN